MLAFGACVVGSPEVCFYQVIKPISERFEAEALAMSGLDRAMLMEHGYGPAESMRRLDAWITRTAERYASKPVFVGNNAPFDWMFTCWYFNHFLGRNPFGHAALDIRSYAMGRLGVSWSDSSLMKLPPAYRLKSDLSHNALDDARQQADVFHRLMAPYVATEDSDSHLCLPGGMCLWCSND